MNGSAIAAFTENEDEGLVDIEQAVMHTLSASMLSPNLRFSIWRLLRETESAARRGTGPTPQAPTPPFDLNITPRVKRQVPRVAHLSNTPTLATIILPTPDP